MFEEISFRPLTRADLPLLERWLAEPHVDAWWHQALDLAGLEKRYGPSIDGINRTHVFIIVQGGEPIGLIQWYRWSDYPGYASPVNAGPEAAGIDLAIGDPEKIGLGIGPVAIRQFVEQIVLAGTGLRSVTADPAVGNIRSIRAFEKAGFSQTITIQRPGEDFQRRVMRL